MSGRPGLLLPAVITFLATMQGSGRPGITDNLIEVEFPEPPPEPYDVFVSYCEQDQQYWDRIEVHLKPMRRRGIRIYSFDTIEPGAVIPEKARFALQTSVVAVLLISADYLASELMMQELLDLLEQAKRKGTLILRLQAGICDLTEMDALTKYQSIGAGRPSLRELRQPNQDKIYVELLRAIRQTLIKHQRY